ncbi:MAG TPA: SDR family oxidoreductase [Quisquiliibacterium sp.]|nr:SDR family oxidoreductase [Quisquiliibacterium sp.]
MTKRKVLVAGASGLVGFAAIRHFRSLPGWEVVGVSRRRPPGLDDAPLISVDLTDRARCAEVFGAMGDVTHVVYAALYEKDDLVAGWRDPEQMRVNDAMLRNLLDPLLGAAAGLEHVTLLQGTKAYGAHVEPVPVPARERWPRHPHENFYWLQEDYLRERQADRPWSFTILRPQVIFGESIGGAMNPVPAIGVYAALLKEEGRPLSYPGGARRIFQAVDADLLARACAWAATSPACRNETFNINNGEAFEWATVWPAIADAFGMRVGEPAPLSLAQEMPGRQAQWSAIHRKYGLRSPESLRDFVGLSFQYADRNLGYGSAQAAAPTLVSTVKARLAGFHDCVDTEEMFVRLIRRFQELKWLPPR